MAVLGVAYLLDCIYIQAKSIVKSVLDQWQHRVDFRLGVYLNERQLWRG